MARISRKRSFQEASPIATARRKRGLSQRALAEEAQISRGRLRRLEGGGFEEASFRELKRIATVLGLEAKRLIAERGELGDEIYHIPAGKMSFQFDGSGVGYRITSLVPASSPLFAGKLFVFPKRLLSEVHVPRARIIFLQMSLGSLVFVREGERRLIREGETLLFEGELPYRLENPGVRESVALLVTQPSFVSRGGVENPQRAV